MTPSTCKLSSQYVTKTGLGNAVAVAVDVDVVVAASPPPPPPPPPAVAVAAAAAISPGWPAQHHRITLTSHEYITAWFHTHMTRHQPWHHDGGIDLHEGGGSTTPPITECHLASHGVT